ncbi:MAG: hypothetical protein O8C66_08035 [Candidatus Methanoperedens sp.]|nr:hypothetical protein [Candidatus Methanoperedens sp.]MCZ7370445.1 hypothetical protein [Candidatus Methanoperedens sp.]
MMPSARDISKNEYFLKSEDAVAEVLDYISITGIILLSLSIIGVAGYPVLRNAQESSYVENTRQSFVVVGENLNKVALGQAPSRMLELKLYGGRLSVGRGSTIKINVTWYNLTKPGNEETTLYSEQMGNIQNSIGDTIVAYESTGVWIKYPNGVVLNAYKPMINKQNNKLVIPVVRINGNYSVGGNGLSRIRAEGEPGVTFWSNVSSVTITITGDYVSGWRNYLNNTMKWDIQIGGPYTARLNATPNLDVYILNTDMVTEIE